MTTDSPVEPSVKPWLVAVLLSMPTFTEVLGIGSANVSLPHIAGTFGATRIEVIRVLSSYLLANAAIVPVGVWLSSVLGGKRYYLISLALFTVSSLMCGIAPSLGMLLLCRVLQGAGGGALVTSEQAMLADTFPGAYFITAFTVYALAVIVTPAIGPVLGGWMTDNWSWRLIFFINVPVGVLSLLLAGWLGKNPRSGVKSGKHEPPGAIRAHHIGFALTALVFVYRLARLSRLL